MASYDIRFAKSFEKDLRGLPRQTIPVIVEKTFRLAEDPRPVQSRKLRGTNDEYRLRIGNYRVFYTIDDKQKVVTVYHVAHRREAYR
jgi:mRNA interferase RelE/StbE